MVTYERFATVFVESWAWIWYMENRNNRIVQATLTIFVGGLVWFKDPKIRGLLQLTAHLKFI